MAFLGYFTQFCAFLRDIYNFSNRVASCSVIFSIELEYFELKLNQLNDFDESK